MQTLNNGASPQFGGFPDNLDKPARLRVCTDTETAMLSMIIADALDLSLKVVTGNTKDLTLVTGRRSNQISDDPPRWNITMT